MAANDFVSGYNIVLQPVSESTRLSTTCFRYFSVLRKIALQLVQKARTNRNIHSLSLLLNRLTVTNINLFVTPFLRALQNFVASVKRVYAEILEFNDNLDLLAVCWNIDSNYHSTDLSRAVGKIIYIDI